MSALLAMALCIGGGPLALDAAELPCALSQLPGAEIERQTRVRREVIVRITPLSAKEAPAAAAVEAAEPDPADAPRRRPGKPDEAAAKCVPLADIAGVTLDRDRRLLLHLRDRKVIAVGLERSCPARGFYSGFYVTRPSDGMLCEGRDTLHARSGVSCDLASFADPRSPPAASATTSEAPAKP